MGKSHTHDWLLLDDDELGLRHVRHTALTACDETRYDAEEKEEHARIQEDDQPCIDRCPAGDRLPDQHANLSHTISSSMSAFSLVWLSIYLPTYPAVQSYVLTNRILAGRHEDYGAKEQRRQDSNLGEFESSQNMVAALIVAAKK